MAYNHHILQHAKSRFESPVKVFAKLKSKVQREELCAKDGIFSDTANESLYGEKHFLSPRKRTERTESTWLTNELKENQRVGSYRDEAQVLTLSPIPSPQAACGRSYLDIRSKPVEEMPTWLGYTPRKRPFLESTAVSHPLSLCNRTTQSHIEKPQTRHTDGFMVTSSRTPVKMHPQDKDCVRGVFVEACAPLQSQGSMFSPMRKRLRKRKLEHQDFNKVSNDVFSQPQQGKTASPLSEDDSDAYMEDFNDAGRFSADKPGMNWSTSEAMFPPISTAVKRCQVRLQNIAPMFPAKMFAYLKERENKAEREVNKVSSSTRDLFNAGNSHRSRDTRPPATHDMGEIPAFVGPVHQSSEEPADSQSGTDPSEHVQSPAEPSLPVLLMDPLVFNSPRISIPKKHSAVFKRNNWPETVKIPSSVIHLKKWYLGRNHKGLFVEGIHQKDNIPWISTNVVERVNKSVLKTFSGRVYILVGKMNFGTDSGFPNWFLKNFLNGFPENWKTLYEKFLSEKDRGTTRSSEGRGIKSKTKSESSSVKVSVKQHRPKPPKMPASCPPAPSSSRQVSRSGRVIKTPLEYWKGGRVILDAHMNVTIHECYETSICIPKVSTRVSERPSKKPAPVFLPCAEGKQEAPALLRKVKSQPRKCIKAKVYPKEQPCSSPEPPGETRLCVDTVLQKQMKPEKSSTKNSMKQTLEAPEPSVRVLRRTQAVSSSPQSPSDYTSEDDVFLRRTKKDKEAPQNRGRQKVLNKSRQSHRFPSSSSLESSDEIKRKSNGTKTNRVAQTQIIPTQRENTKISPKPLPKTTSKKEKKTKNSTQPQQDEDEAEWTEAELMKLRQAASYYPKSMTGYWAMVARTVGTHSVEECHRKLMCSVTSETPAKKPSKSRKQKVEAPKDQDRPVISARVGTLKRKQQVRQFLKAMPKEDVDDAFSSEFMHHQQFEMPSMCPSEENDCALSEQEPRTPGSTGFPEAKTPQCLDVRPDMIDSPNTTNDDKYTFQLQKRMKKYQYNLCKQAPSSKNFTPSAKRTMRRCGNTENDTFFVWEMFPGNDAAQSDSGEEEDFYFSDN
ncbi:mis18-binding protein 1 [Labrus mixtus]|uniref:mis18-binding protein 1 n=1 Tax=Labrus mixtus TaxID=508554 RepID=UPI0029C0BC56|nr:mis18-binding protein 1 [Labrus mixtus]